MRRGLAALLLCVCAMSPAAKAAGAEKPAAGKVDKWFGKRMVVSVPVADIRSQPKRHIGQYVQDPDQETQVVAGEPVIVKERKGKWTLVECPLQPEFTHNSVWEGYPGWIETRFLSKDLSKEEAVTPQNKPVDELRADVIRQAARHLGNPYLWGGRSLHDTKYSKTVTGVDCSGLVNWSFRQVGRIVPRDAHEQWMRAKPLEPAQMKPGDLIFIAKRDQHDRITHVAFYEGDEKVLEAPQSGEAVREIGFRERFGLNRKDMGNGITVGDRVIYFGTLFEER